MGGSIPMNIPAYLIKQTVNSAEKEVEEVIDADKTQRRNATKSVLIGGALGGAAGAGLGYGGVRATRNIIAPKLEAAAAELRSPRLARLGAGMGALGVGIPVAAGLAIGEAGRQKYYNMLRAKLMGHKEEMPKE